jgi:hypothetical protein
MAPGAAVDPARTSPLRSVDREQAGAPALQRRIAVVGLVSIAALYVAGITANVAVDPDAWHEMASFREALALGHIAKTDSFAYTETLTPVVDHEWGMGALLYFVATRTGAAGWLVLAYGLALAIAVAAIAHARRLGASFAVLCPVVPIGIVLAWGGFSAVRAQAFTLLFTVVLLHLLELDRRGSRRWIWAWLALHVLWLNLHGGFVVGVLLVATHTIEQKLRGARVGHLVLAVAASCALVMINPYGKEYYAYLWRALRMARPAITEWAPVWKADPLLLPLFAFSIALFVYAVARSGVRRLPGVGLVLVCALAAASQRRHVPIYAWVWIASVPAFLEPTPLAAMLHRLWRARSWIVFGSALALAAICVAKTWRQEPWKLRIPANPGDHPLVLYPVGAVDYLARAGFRGNLMTNFNAGAFVTWKLHPGVRVSLDSRYEVAYPPGALEDSIAFYDAKPGWQAILAKAPTDAVLAKNSAPIVEELAVLDAWERVWTDDVFTIFARSALGLSREDARGKRLEGSFP